MKHYRLYKLDAPAGRIVKGKDMHAPDDVSAIEQARQDDDCPICEVWQGTKVVAAVDR